MGLCLDTNKKQKDDIENIHKIVFIKPYHLFRFNRKHNFRPIEESAGQCLPLSS